MEDSTKPQPATAPASEAEQPACPNCHAPLYGQFCYQCGQNQKGFDRYLLTLLSEALEDIVKPNSRAARTLLALLFRPGFLTQEYFAGRRARYVQPVRLYFVTSIIFFSLLSLENILSLDNKNTEEADTITVANDDGNYVGDLTLPFLSSQMETKVIATLNRQIEKAIALNESEPGAIKEQFLDFAPPLVFCLLPFLAALLQVLYVLQGRYYAEHIVWAVHTHSFAYIAFIVDDGLNLIPVEGVRDSLQVIVACWIAIYIYLSLKATYRQGWFITSVKFVLLGISYWILFAIFALIALLLGIMSI